MIIGGEYQGLNKEIRLLGSRRRALKLNQIQNTTINIVRYLCDQDQLGIGETLPSNEYCHHRPLPSFKDLSGQIQQLELIIYKIIRTTSLSSSTRNVRLARIMTNVSLYQSSPVVLRVVVHCMKPAFSPELSIFRTARTGTGFVIFWLSITRYDLVVRTSQSLSFHDLYCMAESPTVLWQYQTTLFNKPGSL